MRTRTGITRRKRHNKIKSLTKGFRMSKGTLYKVSQEAYMHAGNYAYAHRQRRPSQIRKIWTHRINAAAKLNGMQYGKFMNALKEKAISLNRKVLADIALNHPESFSNLVKSL